MAMLNSSVEHQTLQQSGGYDILATSSGLPEGAVSWDNLSTGDLSGRVADFLGLTRGGALIQVPGLEGPLAVDLLGVDESFAGASRLTFYRMDPNYSSPEALWTAVMLDPNLAVVDRLSMPNDFGPSQVRVNAGVGDILEVASPVPGGEKRSLRVIGVLDQFLLQGIFLQAPAVASLLGAQNPTVFYFKASDAGEIRSLAHDLERTYLPYGMVALVIRDFVEDILKTTLSVIQLLQGFLALGLLVGIAGLGIIAMRNVVERRSETGALRALGFRRSMVLHAFLIEMTFIILLGLGIGVVLGILLSYTVYLEFFAGIARFEIPWANLALIGVLAYFSAILATLSPGRRAASIPPAEALRRME
jgi:putative ABC transport system permease protein